LKNLLNNKFFTTISGVAIIVGCSIMVRHDIIPFISASLICVTAFYTLLKLIKK
jgi:hypothetical protein